METSPKRIAWIGLGVMGLPMAGHLLRQGHRLTVYTRTRGKASPLLEQGAAWADTPAAASDGADIAISMVGMPSDVEETHLGPSGTLAAANPPKLLIDMTTSRPSLARRIHREAARRGAGSLDAPVSGGDVGARNASLSIMVGGDAADFERALPILRAMGRTIIHQGGPGAGQHTKMVNQILIASHMMGACEGLLYAIRAGLDATKVIESVGSGAAGSWAINNLGPRMIRRDFEPGFFVEHFIKDLGIALDEAAQLGLALPGLALASQLYEAVKAQGHGRAGTQALLLMLERLNGLEAAGPSAKLEGASPPSRL
ncbi:MAG: NAD(P)-dependent oxidoreductase [Phycisphaeraceae bacterium]|nr:NAD(P)-dependent oxidoreductase [Phycisphaerales bacterium]QOJ16649.1 MAG: NAD(P)-dependent oxidoreductase [Phycisphaeraceae bacterium]